MLLLTVAALASYLSYTHRHKSCCFGICVHVTVSQTRHFALLHAPLACPRIRPPFRYTPNASSPGVAAYEPVLPGQRYLPLDTTSGTTRPGDCGEPYRGPTAVYRTRLVDVYGGNVQYPYWEAAGALYGPVVLVADIMVGDCRACVATGCPACCVCCTP